MLTEKQQEYLRNCTHRWNVKAGATGSGKSYLDIMVTIPQRILRSKGEGLLVMLGNTRGTLERNILEPMRALYTSDVVGNIRSDNTAMIFGKKVYCLGADNKKHVERIQGATFEWAYGDEVTTWSPDVFQMLKSRLRCPHSHFDGTCNPASPNHWFKAFLDSDSDIYCQNYTIWDGALKPEVIREIERDYGSGTHYDRYVLGLWTNAEGLIFPGFHDALEDSYRGPVRRWAVSCDYGTQNPFALLLWAFDGNTWHVVSEYRYGGRDTGHQKTDEEYVGDVLAFMGAASVPRDTPIIIDPSATSFKAALRRKDINVKAAVNDVDNGIRDTNTALNSGRVRISRDLPELRKEFAGYIWDSKASDRGEDKPLKQDDHLMDALRYGVETLHIVSRDQRDYRPVIG